ncbi:hypothetical protein [Ochrobactrum soli]|uniref:Uncharacterized protein n=1 Tax=Ochrobactrum soli TaxID=2448455 RepID=A0A849KKF2_9HYPH|nr:hypothetical protein [[Ochrobactrum] soli]NNU60853.1 hypothetical protein [[Ochrobactrum] soli]
MAKKPVVFCGSRLMFDAGVPQFVSSTPTAGTSRQARSFNGPMSAIEEP